MAIKTQRANLTNIVELNTDPVEIISVQGKRTDQTFFTNIQGYTVAGKTIITRKIYDEIKVQYEDGVKTQFQLGLEKNFLNGQMSLFGNNIEINKTQEAGKKAQSQRASVQVSKNGSVLGLNVGGLVSLAENVQEKIVTTDEPVISILTDTVQNVNLSKVSVSKSDISTLTGKATENGFLNVTLTTGAPVGLNTALSDAGVPASLRKAALEVASTVPSEVIEVSVDTNPLQKIASGFTKQIQKTVKTQNENLGNPLGFNKLLGQIGLPKTNVLGSLIGKLLGVVGISLPGDIMPSLPAGVSIPTDIPTPPDIIQSNSFTNISKNVNKPQLVSPQVKNSIPPYNPIAEGRKFQGVRSSTSNSTYVFEDIGGPEELKFELMNATRELTTMVVHWSKTPSDLDWGSKEIAELHTSTQVATRPDGISGPAFLESLDINGGLQFHYIIKKNGTIQRGRPVDISGPTLTGFGQYAVHVAFVAGFTCPSGTPNKEKFLSEASITSEQWKSFDELIKAFDAAKNGSAEFVGFNQMPYGLTGPGFDVQEYVKSKFNKSTVYIPADFNRTRALSPEEIISRTPVENPPKPTPVNNPPATEPPPILSDVPSQAEIDRRNAEWQDIERKIKRRQDRIERIKENLEKEQLNPNITAEERTARLESRIARAESEITELQDQQQELRKKFNNDGYIFDNDVKRWIHESQYGDTGLLDPRSQAAAVEYVTWDDVRGKFRAFNPKTRLFQYFDNISEAEAYTKG